MAIFTHGKKVYPKRACGCAGKGGHKAACPTRQAVTPSTITPAPTAPVAPVVPTAPVAPVAPVAPASPLVAPTAPSVFNPVAPTATFNPMAQGTQAFKLTEQQAVDLFLASVEDSANLMTPFTHTAEDGSVSMHYAPLYYTYSGHSKDGSVLYYNCANAHDLRLGGLVYPTNRSGIGIASRIWGGNEPPTNIIFFMPLIMADLNKLV